ncbi:uncharacterized protein [Temnothorax nylanderi]|uniref:uncharacterized protein n=1 Tax=Temnothorax nylanderi TaxID=102681 RepID=UPI003A891AB8
MFLIHCQTDNSYCKVEDFDVIYDEENIPNPGELVTFLWKNSKFNGTVIMQSADENKINKKLQDLNKIKKNQSTSDTASNSSALPKTTKRVSRASNRWSPEKKSNADNSSQKRRKRTASKQESKDASQNFIEQIVLGKDKPSKLKKLNKEKSPSKDDLKKELEAMKSKLEAKKYEKKVDDSNNSSATTESSEDSDLSVSGTENDGKPLADDMTGKNPSTAKEDDNKLINTSQKDNGETPVISGASKKLEIDNDGKLLDSDGKSIRSEKDKENIENKTKNDSEKEDDDKYYDEDIQLLGPDYCRKVLNIYTLKMNIDKYSIILEQK